MNIKKRTKIILFFFLSLFAILFLSFFIYTANYSKATISDINHIYSINSNIKSEANLTTVYPPKDIDKNIGLIFYPGGKVEDKSYLPLLHEISQYGITCILVKMPFNLAIFNSNAADDIYEKYPSIKKWYLSGHSLGGAMASSYAKENYEKLDGLILLASYPLNDADVKTISIYGSLDTILDSSKLTNVQNKIKIIGANHANFGNYGNQKGDSIATIPREEQQKITVDTIIDFIFKK